MAWIQIILAVLQAIPQLISLIKRIIDAINAIPSGLKRQAYKASLRNAIKQAKQDNSSKPLEKLLAEIQNDK